MRTVRALSILITIAIMGLASSDSPVSASDRQIDLPEWLLQEAAPKHPPPHYVPKSPGHYSRDDWAAVIDSTWGVGLPTFQKEEVFSSFWNTIDDYFACFQDLGVDWDSVSSTYAPEFLGSVSKGRFGAILNHASLALKESHTQAKDTSIINTELLPGVPLMYVGKSWIEHHHFGAGLTPLEDSSLLVYKSVDSHPLGLIPGDRVLGYDRMPWKDLYQQLLEAELPIKGSWGCSESALSHRFLMAAGLNWHLFDTIDVVKYGSGDTLHLSTGALVGQQMNLFVTEQLEVPGVPLPYSYDDPVTWGIVDGADVGYVYEIIWWGDADTQLENAVDSLMHEHETIGLIFDFRTNAGGNMFLAYPALELLFNTTVYTIGFDYRDDPDDHLSMRLGADPENYKIVGDPGTYYDKPIAILTGPNAVSSGDQIALAMSFHPMARVFGKSTAAAFNSPTSATLPYPGFTFRYASADAWLASNPGHYLTHDEFPVDEYVWFTPDGVAEGKDDVVEAAIDWIMGHDADDDGVNNGDDNCRMKWNPNQEDTDTDGIGDSCDNCIFVYNPDQSDSNGDGVGDACEWTCGDADANGAVDIDDVVHLVNYIFAGGPEPVPYEAGDSDCSAAVDIDDVVYLIAYIFSSGNAPCDTDGDMVPDC